MLKTLVLSLTASSVLFACALAHADDLSGDIQPQALVWAYAADGACKSALLEATQRYLREPKRMEDAETVATIYNEIYSSFSPSELKLLERYKNNKLSAKSAATIRDRVIALLTSVRSRMERVVCTPDERPVPHPPSNTFTPDAEMGFEGSDQGLHVVHSFIIAPTLACRSTFHREGRDNPHFSRSEFTLGEPSFLKEITLDDSGIMEVTIGSASYSFPILRKSKPKSWESSSRRSYSKIDRTEVGGIVLSNNEYFAKWMAYSNCPPPPKTGEYQAGSGAPGAKIPLVQFKDLPQSKDETPVVESPDTGEAATAKTSFEIK